MPPQNVANTAVTAPSIDGQAQVIGDALALAGISDLTACVQQDPLAAACSRVMGGSPADVPQNYRQASPAARLPTGRRQSLIHGIDDEVLLIRSGDFLAL